MNNPVTIALVGLGGYGNTYLNLLLESDNPQAFRLVAGIDPSPQGCEYLANLKDASIPIFPDLDSFYRRMNAELVIISTPIHLHAPMTREALSKGSYVLCEKPLTATVQEARDMRDAESKSNQQVAVGFQWSYSQAIIRLKLDIVKGLFGRPRRFRTVICWPRRTSYYGRSPWAGRIRTDDKHWVFDSPLSNATAHHLHNMLYLLGPEEHLSDMPRTACVETYRAKDIENFDTVAFRCTTTNDVEVLFYTTHSTASTIGPMISLEFDDATILYASGTGAHLIARFKDGRIEDYGNPNEYMGDKIWQTLRAIRQGTKFRCGIEAAVAHTLCIYAAQEPETSVFPKDLIHAVHFEDDDTLVHVKGLEESLLQCYAHGILPSEHGNIEWASKARNVSLDKLW